MNTFFDNINKNETGKLIHVGAGNGIEVTEYATQSFTEILLLEPIPKVFKQLESKIDRLNKINIQCNIAALNVALSTCTDVTKEKVFYITLPNRYSSLHKTDKLKTLFQNLKTEQEITVSTINFSDLIKKSNLDKNKKNALVLQINGAEFEVLAQAETDELMQFSSIVIQQSNNNYFEDSKTSTDLIGLMKSKGFQLAIKAENDVVFSSFTFRKDESALKLKYITEQSKTQATRIGELENQLKASNESKVSELTEATAKANASAVQSKTQTARISELENQLKASNEAKTSEINKANTSAEQSKRKSTRIGELENQLKASNETKAGALNKASELETQITEQNKNKNNRIGELENQLKASNEAKTSEINKANTSVEQSKRKSIRIGELENQLKASNETKAGALNKASELETQISEQNKNKNNRISELENQLKASNETKAGALNKASELETQISEQNKNKNNRISELENQLKAKNEQVETSNKLNKLLEKIENQNNLINKNHKSIVSNLKSGLDNSVKQVESFIGVQSYLETGQLAMEYHGWPISSDVALFLLGKIERNNYDLIIEFGSGTSTQLFAKAINNHITEQASHIDDDLSFIGSDKTDSSSISTIPLELPNRIVTFEHNKKYHRKTMSELKANKLSHLVDLVHAPLIEMKVENEDYLYYSCESKLSQLAAIYAERTARILILIDGPPGVTGPLARLPAVPLLLNYLGKHQLDIVLDDYKREEEKETVVRWKKQFEKRYFDYDEEQVQCEKGVFFCRINP